jgi:hypothetical protein
VGRAYDGNNGPGTMEETMPQYWYNVKTHQVEQDAQSGWKELIGPYNTREEAEAAPAKVNQRNEDWEAQDDD